MEVEILHLVVVAVVTVIVEGVMHLIFRALWGFVSPKLGRLWRRLAHQKEPQAAPVQGREIPNVVNLFSNAKVVRFRGDHNKYLYAGEDEISVTQDESGSSENVCWIVEFCSKSKDKIRLKSCYDKYLTASNKRFLLGFTGRKVLQMAGCLDSSVEWQPIQEGNRVKLRTRDGNFLRANGGIVPWRDSVTHDIPWVLQDLVLWDVDVVENVSQQSLQPGIQLESSESWSSSESNSPSFVSEEVNMDNAENALHCSTSQNKIVPSNKKIQSVMELFRNAKTVRLRGKHKKFLSATEDKKTVTLDESGFLKNSCWTVEFSSESENKIRLKSCFGKYLTASNKHSLLSVAGCKVLQTASCLDSSVEWQLIRKGNWVKLKTQDGKFLRANDRRNSVTHDVPIRKSKQDCVL